MNTDLLNIELLLDAWLERLEAKSPTVEVDLTELLLAVRSLPVPPSPEEIARAIAKVLAFPQPIDTTPLLVEMMGTLQQTTQELKGIGKKLKSISMPVVSGGTVTINNKDGQPVPVTGTVTSTSENVEQRLDYSTRTDGNPVYVGEAAPGTATSAASWTIKKLTFDASNRTTRIQVQTDISWDNRAVGW